MVALKALIWWVVIVRQKAQRWTKINNTFPNGSPYHVPNFNEMTMRSPCWEAWGKYNGDECAYNHLNKLKKFDLENWTKIETLKKWLTVIPNWKHYKHPLVTPLKLDANLTSFECHEVFKIIFKTSNLGNEFALYGSNFKLEIKDFPLEGFKTPHLNVMYAL